MYYLFHILKFREVNDHNIVHQITSFDCKTGAIVPLSSKEKLTLSADNIEMYVITENNGPL